MVNMRSFRLALIGMLVAVFAAEVSFADETESFTIAPSAPPVAALKYKLLFGAVDRQPGNAAVYYLNAMLLETDERNKDLDKAEDALEHGDNARFQQVMASFQPTYIMQKLESGAMCDSCDWQPEVRRRGMFALLPYLNNARSLARLAKLNAEFQMRGGSPDQALATFRIGYELGKNVGRDPVVISMLVGVGIDRLMDNGVMDLMRRPDAPNLYWALVGLPPAREWFIQAMDWDRLFPMKEFGKLADASPDDLSGDDWQAILDRMTKDVQATHQPGGTKQPDFSKDNGSADLPAAQSYYAETRRVTADEAAKEDFSKVLGIYYYEQYQTAIDEGTKYSRLPYPVALSRLERVDEQNDKLEKLHPANPFLQLVPHYRKALLTCALADREVAAMADVEAIRSFAAANNGQLPAHLADIFDTPAVEDPLTGKPFDYRVENGAATISDSVPESHSLKYVVRIQQ